MKKLIVTFYVFYLEPDAAYPFNGKLISELQRRISRKSLPSETLQKKFPGVERISFWFSASRKLKHGVIRHAKYSRTSKEAEFQLTLPYSSKSRGWKRITAFGLKHAVSTIENFFVSLELDVPESWNKADILEMFSQAPESFVDAYEQE